MRIVEIRPARLIAASLFVGLSLAAHAAEFRSIAENGVVMYDAPSTKANKLFVATRNYPVELISSDGIWVKVRDAAGDLTWVEKKSLADRRAVIVNVPIADVRQKADDQAPLAFQAAQGVALEVAPEQGPPGWVRVRYRDGTAGFVKLNQIWGY